MLGLGLAAVFAPLQVVTGDLSARHLAHRQPEKFAAMEGQFATEKGAPLRIGGIPFPDDHETKLRHRDPQAGQLHGLRGLRRRGAAASTASPRTRSPNVYLAHFPFQIMVALGFTFVGVGVCSGACLVEEDGSTRRLLLLAAGRRGRARLRRHRGGLVRHRVRTPAVGHLPGHEDVRRRDAARRHLGAAHGLLASTWR